MVTDRQKRNLEYFKNKVVTILSQPINRNFTEEACIDYFVGKITQIDDSGIWYEHIKTKCLNFIFYDKIVTIAEEKVISAETVDEQPEVFLNGDNEIKPIPNNIQDLKSIIGL